MGDPFLTVAEVAALLKLNQQTVRNWIDRGELRAVRVGPRRVRIRQSDLDTLLSGGTSAAANVVDERIQPNHEAESAVAELWARFGSHLSETHDCVAKEDVADLVKVLRALADSANRLADAIID